MAREGFQGDLDVRPGSGGVGPLYLGEIALQDIDAQLIAGGGLARVLVGTKDAPLLGDPLLLDVEVCAVSRHETIVQLVLDETALEAYLWFG